MPKSSKRKHETRRANRDRRERLDELRRQQRANERRKNMMFAGAGTLVALGLIAGAVVPAYLHDKSNKAKQKVGYQASPTSAEKAADCLGVHNDPLSPAGDHIANKTIDYSKQKYGDTEGGTEALPPSGGPHNPVPLSDKDRFFSLDSHARPERAVHNLEHGYVVAWYDDQLPDADVEKLKTLAADPSLSELLVVPWYGSALPADKHVVLTSWARTERCGSVSDPVVRNFYNDHVNSSLAPEVGAGAMGADAYPPDTVNTSPTGSASATPGAQTSASVTTGGGDSKKKKK